MEIQLQGQARALFLGARYFGACQLIRQVIHFAVVFDFARIPHLVDGDVDIAQPPVGDRRAVLVFAAFDRGKVRVSHLVPVVLAGHVAGDPLVP